MKLGWWNTRLKPYSKPEPGAVALDRALPTLTSLIDRGCDAIGLGEVSAQVVADLQTRLRAAGRGTWTGIASPERGLGHSSTQRPAPFPTKPLTQCKMGLERLTPVGSSAPNPELASSSESSSFTGELTLSVALSSVRTVVVSFAHWSVLNRRWSYWVTSTQSRSRLKCAGDLGQAVTQTSFVHARRRFTIRFGPLHRAALKACLGRRFGSSNLTQSS